MIAKAQEQSEAPVVAMGMTAPERSRLVATLLWTSVLGACFLWAYWPGLTNLAARWQHDPQYSHGYIVPLFAVALLWLRRSQIEGVVPRPTWWGLALLLVAA